MNLSELSAPALDALLAEWAGYAVRHITWDNQYAEMSVVEVEVYHGARAYEVTGVEMWEDGRCEVWSPSTDANDALAVLQRWEDDAWIDYLGANGWSVMLRTRATWFDKVFAPSLPRAITLALLATGEEGKRHLRPREIPVISGKESA